MKKHDKILMLAKSKLNSIEILISQALNDMEISHEEFNIILKEKVKYKRMKYILENENKNKKLQRTKMLCKENFTKLQRMRIRNQLSQQQKII